MQIIFHTGAHCTDDERLLKALLKNRDSFAARRVAVPGPGKYRSLLKQTFQALETAPPSDEALDILLDAILDEEDADRVILSNPHFFGSARFALSGSTIYPLAAQRVSQMKRLFRPEQVEIFMALRNPASFLPALLGNMSSHSQYATLSGIDLNELRWSDMIERIQKQSPRVPITVWCNEDTPLIWAEIIRTMAGLSPGEKITGGFDMLAEIMRPEGMREFRAHLHRQPPMEESRKREIMLSYLDRYGIDDRIEEELDLPGWTDQIVEGLSEAYEDDLDLIAEMPGVRLILP